MDGIPTLVQLIRSVSFRIADRWHDIGVQLHFTGEELSEIEKNHQPVPVQDCCKSMLYLWKRRTACVTAKQLINAIDEAGYTNYASQLQKGTYLWYIDVTVPLKCSHAHSHKLIA